MHIDLATATQFEKVAFWTQNLRTALAMMERITPFQVNLNDWRQETDNEDIGPGEEAPVNLQMDEPTCGTIACFGGWCAWEPAFRELGVQAGLDGVPRLPRLPGAWCSAWEVAEYLFGDEALFNSATYDEEDAHENHHEIVLARINKRLEGLGA
jgi:hypothetical protein